MVPFAKYTAAGNDFVLVDEGALGGRAPASAARDLCRRRLGVGADGLLVVRRADEGLDVAHFEPDGARTFCLNGCRVAAAWGGPGATDGAAIELRCEGTRVPARVAGDGASWDVWASVPAPPACAPRQVELPEGVVVLGTLVDAGNPQFVVVLDDEPSLEDPALMRRARALRWSAEFDGGTNVTFVAPREGGGWRLRTYERGVEGETLACGTGAVAAAWALTRDARAAAIASGARSRAQVPPGVASTVAPPRELAFRAQSGDSLDVLLPAGAGSARVWARGPVRLVATGVTALAA